MQDPLFLSMELFFCVHVTIAFFHSFGEVGKLLKD